MRERSQTAGSIQVKISVSMEKEHDGHASDRR
jgi:hypothetical protein